MIKENFNRKKKKNKNLSNDGQFVGEEEVLIMMGYLQWWCRLTPPYRCLVNVVVIVSLFPFFFFFFYCVFALPYISVFFSGSIHIVFEKLFENAFNFSFICATLSMSYEISFFRFTFFLMFFFLTFC